MLVLLFNNSNVGPTTFGQVTRNIPVILVGGDPYVFKKPSGNMIPVSLQNGPVNVFTVGSARNIPVTLSR